MKYATTENEWKALSESKQPILNDKDLVLGYMRSCTYVGWSMAYVKDEVTGIETDVTACGYRENGFQWSSSDIYHLEKYDLPLNPEFLDYVRSKY